MAQIIVETIVNEPVQKAWEAYTKPEHITKWNHASDDWHSPHATNDLRVGGAFSYRMEAKDGSEGFDFAGTYDDVVPLKRIAYTFGGRRASVTFEEMGNSTHVRIAFDPESVNPPEMQRQGWQAILDNFKTYTEAR